MRIHLDTLGCRLNQAELGAWREEFRALGHTPVSSPNGADVLVINTCAVTREAARKSRQLIRRTRRANPQARLVVTGCYSTLEQREAAAIDGVDLIVDNRNKEGLVTRAVQDARHNGSVAAQGQPPRGRDARQGESAAAQGQGPAQGQGAQGLQRRAFVKVQDGCRHRCTFCVVTVARGTERDRPVADIISQIRQLQQQGVQEIVLTGVHLGGYGGSGPESLNSLLGNILRDTDVARLRLGSLEPWALSDPLLARFASQRLLPHLHLPLQSGCDRTLKRMARQYRRADFARLLEDIRSLDPHFNISTDLIAGFPGESTADWQDSLTFIREQRLAHCHVFTYSPRSGSAAAQFTGQVPEQEKQARSRAARELSAQMTRDFLHTQIGRRSQVLWEGCNADGHWQGYTENYLRAVLPEDHRPSANISTVTLTATHKTHCLLARELPDTRNMHP